MQPQKFTIRCNNCHSEYTEINRVAGKTVILCVDCEAEEKTA